MITNLKLLRRYLMTLTNNEIHESAAQQTSFRQSKCVTGLTGSVNFAFCTPSDKVHVLTYCVDTLRYLK